MQEEKMELAIAGNTYRVGKLNALQQFHVTRRLGPMLVVAGISVDMITKGLKPDLDDMVAMAGPVMDMIAKMPDDEVNYVLFTCLTVAQRLQGSTYAPLLAPDGKQLMFADMDMPTMIRVVLGVLQHNLGNFLTGLSDAQSSTSN